mgnify:CR=1 FL=1
MIQQSINIIRITLSMGVPIGRIICLYLPIKDVWQTVCGIEIYLSLPDLQSTLLQFQLVALEG